MDPKDKVAIVTGASGGIGEATVRALLDYGAKVALAARSVKPMEKIAESSGESNTLVCKCDMAVRSDIKKLVENTVHHFGRIDLLINNAGVGLAAPVFTMKSEDFQTLLNINVFGPLYAMQEVIPHMIKNGGGIIMNVSSMITRISTPSSSGYRASKMALDAITDAARIELANKNIRVITVYPGLTSTNFFRNCINVSKSNSSHSPIPSKGRPPEFVAQRIISGIKHEPRCVFMGIRGRLGGAVAQLFPGVIDLIMKRKIRDN
jgi:short-subunit dehydrogenase